MFRIICFHLVESCVKQAKFVKLCKYKNSNRTSKPRFKDKSFLTGRTSRSWLWNLWNIVIIKFMLCCAAHWYKMIWNSQLKQMGHWWIVYKIFHFLQKTKGEASICCLKKFVGLLLTSQTKQAEKLKSWIKRLWWSL